MAWWWILLIGFALGLLIVAAAGMALGRRRPRLRAALIALEERKLAADRTRARLEDVATDLERVRERVETMKAGLPTAAKS